MSDEQPGSRLFIDVSAYIAARLALVMLVTAAILGAGHVLGIQDFPVVIALLFAIVTALPLGMWLFAPLRRRATASIAAADARRRRDRAQLQARLRGENAPDENAPGERAPGESAPDENQADGPTDGTAGER